MSRLPTSLGPRLALPDHTPLSSLLADCSDLGPDDVAELAGFTDLMLDDTKRFPHVGRCTGPGGRGYVSLAPLSLLPSPFTSAGLDALIAAPVPWPYLASVYPLSDAQFAALLVVLPQHDLLTTHALRLDPHVTSPARLELLLTHLTSYASLSLSSPLRFWFLRVGSPEHLLAHVLDFLVYQDVLTLLLLTRIVADDPAPDTFRPLSGPGVDQACARLADMTSTDDLVDEIASYIQLLLITQPCPLPRWYLARVVARFPGLLAGLLHLYPGRPPGWFAEDLLAHLTTNPAVAARLLENPACSLSEALSAGRVLAGVAH